MPFLSLVNLKLKQSLAGEKPRGLLKFLLPDFLVGLFMALAGGDVPAASYSFHVLLVAVGVAVFTTLAETRKLFFNGGDMEEFYFVRPTTASRFASLTAIVILNAAVTAAVFTPVMVLSPGSQFLISFIALCYVLSFCASTSLYLIIVVLLAIFPEKIADRLLTGFQLTMAFILMASFQLTGRPQPKFDPARPLPFVVLLLAVTILIFLLFPLSEILARGLNRTDAKQSGNVLSLAERFRKLKLVNSDEEEAGFMFFAAYLSRNSSFRLSTISLAATPIIVAVYWSMQHVRLMAFNTIPGFIAPEAVAPLASLAVSGVVVYYFLSQNMSSSRDHEARWQLESNMALDSGRFVLGFRKGFLIFIHIPVTLLVFVVLSFSNPILSSILTAATFYLLCHVAISWFSVMQRQLPFTLAFTRFGKIETANLVFMTAYSFVVTTTLAFVSVGVESVLLMNIFAFILVGTLEYFSTGIVRKRVKFGA